MSRCIEILKNAYENIDYYSSNTQAVEPNNLKHLLLQVINNLENKASIFGEISILIDSGNLFHLLDSYATKHDIKNSISLPELKTHNKTPTEVFLAIGLIYYEVFIYEEKNGIKHTDLKRALINFNQNVSYEPELESKIKLDF
jgi:hypothetical protein